jgi:hypothetical protein
MDFKLEMVTRWGKTPLYINNKFRPRGVADVVDHQPSKHKVLSSNLSTTKKKFIAPKRYNNYKGIDT